MQPRPSPHSTARISGTAAPALHHWHCTTGIAPRLSRDMAHNPRRTTRQASLDARHISTPPLRSLALSATPIHHLCPPQRFLALCRLLPSTISAFPPRSRTRSLLAKLLFLKDTGPSSSSSSSFSRCESAASGAADASLRSLTPRSALSPLALPSHPSPCSLTRGSTPRVRVARRDLLVETLTNPLASLSSPLAVLLDVD